MKTPIPKEANYDEKAIGRFPNLNTFLVPYQTLREKNNYQNKIQILEVENLDLSKEAKSHIVSKPEDLPLMILGPRFFPFPEMTYRLQILWIARIQNHCRSPLLP